VLNFASGFRRPLSLLLCLIPAWAFAAPPAVPPVDAQVALGAYQGLVEEHLAGVMRAAKSVARSREATSGNWRAVRPLLDELAQGLETAALAMYVLPDGSYYSSDRGDVTDQNLKNRPYFARLMAGEDVRGELVISKSTGHRSIVVATPVRSKRGEVIGGIGVTVRARLLSQLVDRHMPLPQDMYFYALDADQKIALHRNIDRLFRYPAEVGDESLGAVFAPTLKSTDGALEYVLDGKRVVAQFQASSLTGWHFFIARILLPGPNAEADAEARAATDAVMAFLDRYAARDLDGVMSRIAQRAPVFMVGTNVDEKFTGRDALRAAFLNDFGNVSQMRWKEPTYLRAAVHGEAAAVVIERPAEFVVGRQQELAVFRYALTLVKEDGDWRVASGLVSVPLDAGTYTLKSRRRAEPAVQAVPRQAAP